MLLATRALLVFLYPAELYSIGNVGTFLALIRCFFVNETIGSFASFWSFSQAVLFDCFRPFVILQLFPGFLESYVCSVIDGWIIGCFW